MRGDHGFENALPWKGLLRERVNVGIRLLPVLPVGPLIT